MRELSGINIHALEYCGMVDSGHQYPSTRISPNGGLPFRKSVQEVRIQGQSAINDLDSDAWARTAMQLLEQLLPCTSHVRNSSVEKLGSNRHK